MSDTTEPTGQTTGQGELVLYASEDGSATFFLRAQDGTVWLTQMELAELFQTSIPNVNIHIKNVLEEGELQPEATIKEDLIVRLEGKRQVKRPVKLYNLGMILAVGYRVKSPRGVDLPTLPPKRSCATARPCAMGLTWCRPRACSRRTTSSAFRQS